MKLSPLVEEMLHAIVPMAMLVVTISALYWVFTGLSPWPEMVIAQILVFGSGLGVLTLTSPRVRR